MPRLLINRATQAPSASILATALAVLFLQSVRVSADESTFAPTYASKRSISRMTFSYGGTTNQFNFDSDAYKQSLMVLSLPGMIFFCIFGALGLYFFVAKFALGQFGGPDPINERKAVSLDKDQGYGEEEDVDTHARMLCVLSVLLLFANIMGIVGNGMLNGSLKNFAGAIKDTGLKQLGDAVSELNPDSMDWAHGYTMAKGALPSSQLSMWDYQYVGSPGVGVQSIPDRITTVKSLSHDLVADYEVISARTSGNVGNIYTGENARWSWMVCNYALGFAQLACALYASYTARKSEYAYRWALVASILAFLVGILGWGNMAVHFPVSVGTADFCASIETFKSNFASGTVGDASTQAAIALFLRCLNSTTVTAALKVTNEVHARNLRAINFLRQHGDCSGGTKHNMKEICAIKDLPNAPYFPAPGFGTSSADSAFQNSNEFCFCPIPEEFLGASSGCTKELANKPETCDYMYYKKMPERVWYNTEDAVATVVDKIASSPNATEPVDASLGGAAKGANTTRQMLNSLARCDAVSVAFTEIEKVLCYDTIVAFDVLVSSQVFLGILGMLSTVVAMRSFARFHFENRTDKMTVEKEQSEKMGLDMAEIERKNTGDIEMSTNSLFGSMRSTLSSGRSDTKDLAINVSTRVKRGKKGKGKVQW